MALAMVAAGLAVTFKQTAFPEAVFLGCYCLWQLRAAPVPPARWCATALFLALAGAAPMAAFGLAMAALGHFPEFWQAMAGSNLSKVYYSYGETASRLGTFLFYCAPALLPAVAGLFVTSERRPWARAFMAGWLLAASVGVLLVPNFYHHYALPLLVPASIAASRYVACERVRLIGGYVLAGVILLAGPAFKLGDRSQSRQAMDHIVQTIRKRDPHPRLFVYEGPVYLYHEIGVYPPSPLLFPAHLYLRSEDNVSQYETLAEMKRIIAWRPSVVVLYRDLDPSSENPRTSPLMRGYLKRCRLWTTTPAKDAFGQDELAVYGDCAN